MPDYKKALGGKEDLAFDTARNNSSFNRETSSGGFQTITKINAKHIPVTSALTLGSATTVEEFLSELIDFKTAYDAFIANVGHWDKFLGSFADSATLIATHSAPTDDDVFAFVIDTKSFWHWDEDLGVPAWADTHRTLSDESTPTLGADLDTDSNNVNYGDDSGPKNVQTIGLTTFSEKVIASGSITQSQVLHSIDTEGDAATDDLDQIVPAADCNKIEIKLEDAARIVTLKHNTGANKLSLPYDQDLTMQFGVIYQFTHDGNAYVLNGTHLDTVTQVEAEAGTSTVVKSWTPERIKQAAESFATSIIKQIVLTEDDTEYSSASTIPADNTIPQNTEGVEYTEIATAITPLASGNKLLIEFFCPHLSANQVHLTLALFKDSDADALATLSSSTSSALAQPKHAYLRFEVDAVSTSARTYKIRFGTQAGGTVAINRADDQLFSTAKMSYMKITEYEL